MKKLEKLVIGSMVALVIVAPGCTTVQKTAGVAALTGSAIAAGAGYQSGNLVEGAQISGALGDLGTTLLSDEMPQKYCPKCGKGYTSDLKYCTNDSTELKHKI